MTYTPGLHIIAEFKLEDSSLLLSSALFKSVAEELITSLNLSKVGEVYHDFENGGYTAVVCLTESHLSIHTWPEFGVVTFDVFLSNFMNNNEDKVEEIYSRVLNFFQPQHINKTVLKR